MEGIFALSSDQRTARRHRQPLALVLLLPGSRLCCLPMLPGTFLETVSNLKIGITVYPHLGVLGFPSIPCCRLLGLFLVSSYY